MKNRRSVLAGAILCLGLAGCTSSSDENGDQGNGDDEEIGGFDEEEQQRRDIAQNYSLGLDSLAGGEAGLENGIFNFNLEMYDLAIDSFQSAEDTFERAEDQFSDAIDLTYELGEPEAREICETGESTAITLQNAAERYRAAARYAGDGESAEQVNTRITQGEDYEDEAEKSPPRDLSVLGDLLEVDTEGMGSGLFDDDDS